MQDLHEMAGSLCLDLIPLLLSPPLVSYVSCVSLKLASACFVNQYLVLFFKYVMKCEIQLANNSMHWAAFP